MGWNMDRIYFLHIATTQTHGRAYNAPTLRVMFSMGADTNMPLVFFKVQTGDEKAPVNKVDLLELFEQRYT
jgi:hypothetical protein